MGGEARRNVAISRSSIPIRPLLLLSVVCAIVMSLAQPSQTQVAAGATVGLSSQPSSGFDETALGAVLFVDVGVSNRLAAAGELSAATEIKGINIHEVSSAGVADLNSRHHDTIYSGVIKLWAIESRRLHIAPVGGLGVAWRHTVRYGAQRSGVSAPVPINETIANSVLATTVGLEF